MGDASTSAANEEVEKAAFSTSSLAAEVDASPTGRNGELSYSSANEL